MIEVCTDALQVEKAWYDYSDELGILYSDYLTSQIELGRVFCYKVNGIFAGFISYGIKNRNKEVTIDAVVVLPPYQGMGIATRLIHHVYKETESLYKNLGYVLKAESYEGLPSNSFFNHISSSYKLHTSKTGKYRSFYFFIDLGKLDLFEI